MAANPLACPVCKTALPAAAPGKQATCPDCGYMAPAAQAAKDSGGSAGWFYRQGMQKIGPVSFDQLRRLATDGKLSPTDMVLPAGTIQWVSAKSIPGLTWPKPNGSGDQRPVVIPERPVLPPGPPSTPAPPVPVGQRCWLLVGGKAEGPVPFAQAADWVRAGRVAPATPACPEGETRWRPVTELLGPPGPGPTTIPARWVVLGVGLLLFGVLAAVLIGVLSKAPATNGEQGGGRPSSRREADGQPDDPAAWTPEQYERIRTGAATGNLGQFLMQRTHPTGSYVQSKAPTALLCAGRRLITVRVTVVWTGGLTESRYETDYAVEVTKERVRLSVERDTAILQIDPGHLRRAERDLEDFLGQLL